VSREVEQAWRHTSLNRIDIATVVAAGMVPADAEPWGLSKKVVFSKHSSMVILPDADKVAFLFSTGMPAEDARAWLKVPGFLGTLKQYVAGGFTPSQASEFADLVEDRSYDDMNAAMRAYGTWLDLHLSPQVTLAALRAGLTPQEAATADPEGVLVLGALSS
jgi:hypothetical protein